MNLDNVDLLYLMPSFMQNDRFTIALCKALNPWFQLLSKSARLTFIYGRIDELDDESINSLARQFHVDYFDYTLPIEKKRVLVKNSLRWHKIKGTKRAVEEVSTTVFGNTRLKEWFEYGGKPFFFSLDIDISDLGATQEQFIKLDQLIDEYKNKRSRVEKINILLACKEKGYFAATTCTGEDITVYPHTIIKK